MAYERILSAQPDEPVSCEDCATRHMLINAAGELLAAAGNSKEVSIRAIAAKAGVNSAMINYYFGSKEALIEAVLEFALAVHKGGFVRKFLDENRGLLESRDGKALFITELVRTYAAGCRIHARDRWCIDLVYQISRPNCDMNALFLRKYYQDDVSAFAEVYQLITGDADSDRAYFWYLSTLMPLRIRLGQYVPFNRITSEHSLDEYFDNRYEFFCIRLLLNGWGLASNLDCPLLNQFAASGGEALPIVAAPIQ